MAGYPYATTVPSLYYHCIVTAPPPHSHCTITAVQAVPEVSLMQQKRLEVPNTDCAITASSLHHHCTITG